MKTLLSILLLITATSCTKSQSTFISRRLFYTMIFMEGESPTTGRALNSDTTTGEGFVRDNVKILSTTAYTFSSLQIGVNNIGGCGTCHGWELGLANEMDSTNSQFKALPLYLVKRGVGGTTIADWDSSTTIYHNMVRSVDSGISKLTAAVGRDNFRIALWYEIGINDHIAGTNLATFKIKVLAHFALLRTRYGMFPIFIFKCPPAYSTYNVPLVEISNEIQQCYTIETSDAGMQDAFHWNHAGNKLLAYRGLVEMKQKEGAY